MYNESMMFNPLECEQIPYCPFMRSMYTMPNMLRSEDLNDDLDLPLPEEVGNLNDDSRENTENNNIEDNNFDTENESKDDMNDSSIKIEYDDTQFRAPVNPDRILRMIERNNPIVIRRMVMYGIPYNVALNIVRRIINLTLQYYR